MNFTKWEPSAAALLGLAAFQISSTWNATAPSLSEIRAAQPGDVKIRQQLIDADMTVGTQAAIIGLVISVLTHDPSAVFILLGVFGALSAWNHAILAAESR